MDVVKSCLAHRGRKALDQVIGDMEDAGDAVNTSLIKKAGAKLGLPKGYYPPVKLKISIQEIGRPWSSTISPGFMEIKGSSLEGLWARVWEKS